MTNTVRESRTMGDGFCNSGMAVWLTAPFELDVILSSSFSVLFCETNCLVDDMSPVLA